MYVNNEKLFFRVARSQSRKVSVALRPCDLKKIDKKISIVLFQYRFFSYLCVLFLKACKAILKLNIPASL